MAPALEREVSGMPGCYVLLASNIREYDLVLCTDTEARTVPGRGEFNPDCSRARSCRLKDDARSRCVH